MSDKPSYLELIAQGLKNGAISRSAYADLSTSAGDDGVFGPYFAFWSGVSDEHVKSQLNAMSVDDFQALVQTKHMRAVTRWRYSLNVSRFANQR